jgi:cation:H+ antiporter
VQVLPYLGVVLLLGLLTLPPAWSGLQLIDGVILVAAWAAFFGRALLRRAWRDGGEPLPAGSLKRALLFGMPAIALGALASVIAAQKVGTIFGWSDLIVGLFVIGFLCSLPEAYSAYRFAREGQPTVAISAATGDGIVSLTIALVPTALVGAAVGNVPIYLINLGFLIVVLGLYALLNHRRRGQELGPGLVALFGGLYVGYAVLMAYVLATST